MNFIIQELFHLNILLRSNFFQINDGMLQEKVTCLKLTTNVVAMVEIFIPIAQFKGRNHNPSLEIYGPFEKSYRSMNKHINKQEN